MRKDNRWTRWRGQRLMYGGNLPQMVAFYAHLAPWQRKQRVFVGPSATREQFPVSLQAMRQLFIFVFLSIFSGCQSGESPVSCPDAGQLSWLKGTWKLENEDVFEHWDEDGPVRLTGRSTAIENGDTVLLETMSMEITDGQGAFVVRVVDQNGDQPIAFALTRCAEGRLLFENPQHDFPQRVAYERGENGTLLAWVEGGDRKLTFTYQRAE